MRATFAKLSAVLLFVTSFPAKTFQIAIHRDLVNGKSLGNATDVNAHDHSEQDHTLVPAVNPITLNLQSTNGYWTGTVFVGSNEEHFEGSSKLWVAGFNPGSNAVLLPGGDGVIEYANEEQVKGLIYEAPFTLSNGGNSATAQFVAPQTLPTIDAFSGTGIVGVLGMGPVATPFGGTDTRILPLALSGILGQADSGNKKFAFSPTGNGGAKLIVGGDDPGVQLQGIVNLPLIPGSNKWTVKLDSVAMKVGNTDRLGPNLVVTQSAAFDTGSLFILIPRSDAGRILALPSLQGVVKISSNGWTSSCGKFPDLYVEFSGQSFVLSGRSLETPTSNPSTCNLAIRYAASGNWVFGTPFLNTVYSQFNFGNEDGTLQGNSVGLKPITLANAASISSNSNNNGGVTNSPASGSSSSSSRTCLKQDCVVM